MLYSDAQKIQMCRYRGDPRLRLMSGDAEGPSNSPVNYVFVDYENVHDLPLALIGSKTIFLTLLLGARQTRLDAALVEKLIDHAASVQLVRLNSSGRNALDFALAFYLGKAANADPSARFHVVSKDTGFDSLIEHLRARQIHVRRHVDYQSLTSSESSKPAPAASEDVLARVIAHLQKNIKSRPKSRKRLVSHLIAICGKSATASGVDDLIESLCKAGHLTIGDKEAVTYHFGPVEQ